MEIEERTRRRAALSVLSPDRWIVPEVTPMHVVNQLIDHFRWTEAMTPELQERLLGLGLLQDEIDGDVSEGWCEACHESLTPLGSCWCTWHWSGSRYDEQFDDCDRDWQASDHSRRRHVSRRLRGKRGRRREATVADVRLALDRQFDKWLLPGGRLDRLIEVGSLLKSCGTWPKAARVLMSFRSDRLVEELNRRERYSVRPLFNQLDDFDLALQSFARPWRGQAGAALRRLVEGRPDKRSRKLLKYEEFQQAAQLVELAGHLKQARQHCERQAGQSLTRQRQSRREAAAV